MMVLEIPYAQKSPYIIKNKTRKKKLNTKKRGRERERETEIDRKGHTFGVSRGKFLKGSGAW